MRSLSKFRTFLSNVIYWRRNGYRWTDAVRLARITL
jgi:hypothetical protein